MRPPLPPVARRNLPVPRRPAADRLRATTGTTVTALTGTRILGIAAIAAVDEQQIPENTLLPSHPWIGKSNILHTLYFNDCSFPLPEDFWSPACPPIGIAIRMIIFARFALPPRVASLRPLIPKGSHLFSTDHPRFSPGYGLFTLCCALACDLPAMAMAHYGVFTIAYGRFTDQWTISCLFFARFCYKTGHFYVIPDLGIGRRKEEPHDGAMTYFSSEEPSSHPLPACCPDPAKSRRLFALLSVSSGSWIPLSTAH